jgi:predicted Zn-dependent protease
MSISERDVVLLATQAVLRRLTALALAVVMALTSLPVAPASAQNLPLIRDAEIEGLMRLYTKRIFEAAGINPGDVNVYLINDPRINAFVANGQRIFIHTGLLQQAKSPNDVIGVLAHETGHIAGGHLARMGLQLDRASNIAIITMLIGAAAMIGSGIAGQPKGGQMGQGIMLGGPGLAQGMLLSYARAQESAADQAAVKLLDATGQSGKGMLDLFYKLSNQALASAQYTNPYALTHPMPLERVRNLERMVKASPYFDAADPPALVLRHQLMQAKLDGFLNSAQQVYRKYPTGDLSPPARYARAIAAFRGGDLQAALREIDTLIKLIPADPYFWELKGQALVESGKVAEAVAPLREAVRRLPKSGLIRMLLAQALLGINNQAATREALDNLRIAQRSEDDHPKVHLYMATAYARLGNLGMAELETAEAAYLRGDRELAAQQAKSAQKRFASGSPQWLRANDILNYSIEK